MLLDETAPGSIRPNSDADTLAPTDIGDSVAVVFDAQPRPTQVRTIFLERDAEGARQISGPATQMVVRRHFAAWCAARSPPTHQKQPVKRFERPNQDRGRPARRLRDRIDQIVHAIVQIHVGVARCSVKRCVTWCRTRSGMARRVVLTDVRLHFHNQPRRPALGEGVCEDLAEQLTGNRERAASIEVARKNPE